MKTPQFKQVYKGLQDGESITYNSFNEMPMMPVSEGYTTWNKTGSWRFLRPIYVERIPACLGSCPTANDIELWIRLMEQGKYSEAFKVAKIENPFPAIMGRVCFHPCQNGCNRKELGGSVSINMLERYLADKNEDSELPEKYFDDSGKKIAIIGSGLAGLAAAYHLRRLGHNVTVFEKAKKAGGILRYGIPEYRLPNDIIDKEISILEKMGIELKCSHNIRDAAELQGIRQAYEMVLLATGVQKRRALKVSGSADASVIPALDFLAKVAEGEKPKIGDDVVVIGGGNTACDAARVARRLGANVTILYRRTREEMPAFEEELAHAEEEGVKFEILVSPTDLVTKSKKLHKVICQKMELGDPDDSGRRKPVPILGETIEYKADTALVAIGEELDLSVIPSVLSIKDGALVTVEGGRTDWKDLYAAGDIIEQPRTAVDALSAGKSAAIAIDCHFNNSNFEEIADIIRLPGTKYLRMARYVEFRRNEKIEGRKDEVVDFEQLNLSYFKEIKPNVYKQLLAAERVNGFDEVNQPTTDKTANDEMGRCFHCGRCIECDNCFIYCPDVAVDKKTNGYDIELDFCKGCGVCVEECPRAAMELIEEPIDI